MGEVLQGMVIGLHLLTAHTAGGMEPMNPGLYVRMPAGFTAGAYRNSEGCGSAYAGWTVETADRRFALTVGGVTGYRGSKLSPLVVPSVRVGLTRHASLRVAYLPKPPRYGRSAGLHFSIERGF